MTATTNTYKRKTFVLVILILSTGFVSCSYQFPEEPVSNEGEGLPETFSEFYVLGDTYASGYMDGALYNGGQEYSYANIFGNKLNEIYSEPVFQQAEIAGEMGYNAEASEGEEVLKGKYSLLYRTPLSIYPARNPSEGEQVTEWGGSPDNLKDFSIPGLKSFEVDSNLALVQNAYYNRLGLGSATLLDLIIQRQPTAVLIHLGYQDILNYALNGAAGNANPDPVMIGDSDLTPVSVFENAVNEIINRLLQETQSDIFIANLFNPLQAPYFQTISYALEIEKYSSGYLGEVGSHYTDFNYDVFQYNDVEDGGAPAELDRPRIIVDPMGYPQISPNNRARVIVDEYLNEASLNDGTVIPKWRQLKEGELVLYKTEPQLNESSSLSGIEPLSDAQVLTEPEIEIINQRVAAYNNIIENLVSSNERIHLVDLKSIINAVNEGAYLFNGVRLGMEFNRYGIFSSDGYTLNPRGNAIFTNQLIQAINTTYEAGLQRIDVNAYRGNEIMANYK
ncbi:hypothetical protein G3570_10255 [Balneolaceae bacterium YR4-1]|uniref:GDSL-like Lipase/Acylhydrolase n=1 Tax=Halalkalibaculum roseum TaxID=2709311 RepID=A0A6M1SYI7_9BACT|nr:hypothetical protein [Halalkalibaculum roseum]NGP77016.1 hypothetical protein [Halalkalibaculum roseum]